MNKIVDKKFMSSKSNNSNPTGNLDYEEILEEEIINSYEYKFEANSDINNKNKRFYRLKSCLLYTSPSPRD